MSETMGELNELAAALAKAQGEIMPAPKDADNPYFKSKYASLPAVRAAMQEAFAKNGLSVVQFPEVYEGRICLHTLLLHSSGQKLNCGTLAAEVDLTNPQKLGSAITYFRRYALAAISQTVADDDDDAEAVRKDPKKPAAKPAKQLTGHDVSDIWAQINKAETVEQLSTILKGDAYKTLKDAGPADIYEKTSKLAKARHALLITPPAEQAGEDDEPKPF
jgi:hypothetical protein